MEKFYLVEWAELFIPTHSVLEIVLRGTVMYLCLLLILRFLMLRQSGTIAITDILVIVVIADAAQNGFSKEYQSLTEGTLLVLTIVFWDFALNWLSYRYPLFERLLAPPALPLVENGRLNRRNMRRELITEEELRSHLRQHGVSEVSDVRHACLEPNGEISVVPYEKADSGNNSQSKALV